MLLLFVSSALAGSASQELAAFVLPTDAPAPQVAAVCSPVSGVLDRLHPVLKATLPGALGPAWDEPRTQFWMQVLDPAQTASRGLDPTGAVRLAVWRESDSGEISLPFSGSAEQVDALLANLGEVKVSSEGDGRWRVVSPGDDQQVVLADGRLVVGGAPEVVGSAPQQTAAGLLALLPDGPACTLFVDMDVPLGGKLSRLAAVLWAPLDDAPMALLRLKLDVDAPVALSGPSVPPVGGSTARVPDYVLALGVSPLAILKDPAFIAAADFNDEDLAKIAQLEDKARLLPGATLAGFGDARSLEVAVHLPVVDSRGRVIKPSRLNKAVVAALTADGTDVIATSKTTFQVSVDNRTLYGVSLDGALGFSTSPVLAEDMLTGGGQSWLDPELSSLAALWPVAAHLHTNLPMGNAQAIDALFGLRSLDGTWEVGVSRSGVLNEDLAQVVVPLAVANFLQMQQRARRAELPRNLEAIAEAQEAHKAEKGAYLALPVAPRTALDKSPVDWTVADGAWTALGWNPVGPVRGSYRVELSDDGASFTIVGTIDVDGDGLPARFELKSGGEVMMTTPKEVF